MDSHDSSLKKRVQFFIAMNFICIPFFLAGIFAICAAHALSTESRALKNAPQTIARVLNHDSGETCYRRDTGRECKTTYFITIQYNHPQRGLITKKRSAPYSIWTASKKQPTLSIQYATVSYSDFILKTLNKFNFGLEQNMDVVQFQGHKNTPPYGAYMFFALGLAFAGFGAWGIFYHGMRGLADRYYYERCLEEQKEEYG